jgi:predicted nuclease of restriction endonuclease-like (RecB) superfamily
MNFIELIQIITQTDTTLKQRALLAINQSLTFRNWLTGLYIFEFEQNGEDRAKYGENLLQKISDELTKTGKKGYSSRNLRLNRQFYLCYPQIWQSVIAKLQIDNIQPNTIGQSLIAQFKTNNYILSKTSPEENYGVNAETLIERLSYTHLIELISIDDPLKRAFYEIECIKGNWSVRELERQIGSLLFERTGLSKNKEKLIEITNNKAIQLVPEDIIRDPYFFEFLGLKQTDVLLEANLEELLIKHLQDFLLELGKGFCFEARQKRITIGKKHYFVDLVFYHKILKCNIIIELKARSFEHADISQLNLYLNYYRKNEMQTDDNPPVGILLCTGKEDELVEYATDGWDKTLFVSQFQITLPTEKELKEFLDKEKRLGVIKQ